VAESTGSGSVEVMERIGLIPHPSDPTHPPIEPYISDVLPEVLSKYEWLGLILAVFDSDPGLGDNPQPPSIHVFYDAETGRSGLPMSQEPIKSHSDAERWLETHWQHPRQDFNVNTLAPQLVLKIDDRYYLAVTIQLEKVQIGRLKQNDHWTQDLSGMDESSLDFQIVKTIATDYTDMT